MRLRRAPNQLSLPKPASSSQPGLQDSVDEIQREFVGDLQIRSDDNEFNFVRVVYLPVYLWVECIDSCSIIQTYSFDIPRLIPESNEKYHKADGKPCSRATEIVLMDVISAMTEFRDEAGIMNKIMVKEIKHVCWAWSDGSNVPCSVTIKSNGRVKQDGATQKNNMRKWLLDGNLLATKNRAGEMNQALVGVGFVTMGLEAFDDGLVFTNEMIVENVKKKRKRQVLVVR